MQLNMVSIFPFGMHNIFLSPYKKKKEQGQGSYSFLLEFLTSSRMLSKKHYN